MSNIKEPYSISVWQEELIPVQDWYVKGEERLTREEYEALSNKEGYELHTVMEHYEETQGIIIGAHDMDSVYAAVNPILKKNVNGSVDLTFSLCYKVFDPDMLDYNINPFTQLLMNEAKVKLHFRGKWYDLIVKGCVEDSTNFMYNYTCKDIYINELNKNGFKTELDVELENNQGTVTELAETILLDTDWQVVPTEPINKEENDTTEYSDVIIERKIEPLYVGTLGKEIKAKRVNKYTPDEFADMTLQPVEEEVILPIGSTILLFYSDIVDNNPHPQFLCRWNKINDTLTTADPFIIPSMEEWNNWEVDGYLTDANEDIITNAYNYRVLDLVEYANSEWKDNIPNILDENGFDVYDYARGEKVVRSQKSGYDPDLERFIFKFYKYSLDEEGNVIIDSETNDKVIDDSIEYYGYAKTDILRTDLAQNYLANSDDFTTLQVGWIFDGVPAKKVANKPVSYAGQIYNVCDPRNFSNNPTLPVFRESVLELNLKSSNNDTFYPDTTGNWYFIKEKKNDDGTWEEKYVAVDSDKGRAYEENIKALIYKYKRNGVEGYVDKTDAEIDVIVRETLYKQRYSRGTRCAINTGVAANRDKIGSLTPGEEYLFAVSIGKFKKGEQEPLYGKEILYGATMPDKLYQFIKVDNSYQFTYDSAIKAVKELQNNFENDPYVYYLQHPDYKKEYDQVYDKVFKELELEYEQTYLKTFLLIDNFAKERTKENWFSGGHRDPLIGEAYGYREILLDVFRLNNGKPIESVDSTFLITLNERLQNITVDATIPKQIYDILITPVIDEESGYRYFTGLYPEMIYKTIEYSLNMQKEHPFKKAAYEPMGYDKGMYPEYNENFYGIQPFMNSFNEWLFYEIYYAILDEWFIEEDNDLTEITFPSWTYTSDSLSRLSELLKITYKACYDTNNSAIETFKHAKEYKMPSLTNKEGGTFYRMNKRQWEQTAAAAGRAHIEELEKSNSWFSGVYLKKNETTNEWVTDDDGNYVFEDIASEECFGYLIGTKTSDEDDKEIISTGLVQYCHQKEREYHAVLTEQDLQSQTYLTNLHNARISWIEEYNEKTSAKMSKTGVYYTVNFLPLFFDYWVDEKDVGTYTYAQDEYQLASSTNENDSHIIETETLPKPYINEEGEVEWLLDKTYKTCSNEAEYYAYEDSNGGYVFDRNRGTVRLFDPYTDILNATFIPVKDDEGDYVYDVFHQHYRPYRDWDSKVRKDPLTFEDDENGVLGDNVHHPIKAFDGHLFDWYDKPTRYFMKRKYEDPDDSKYQYLTDDVDVIEKGHYRDENQQRVEVSYVNHYSAGYQVDVYVKDKRGKYILSSSVPEKKKLFGIKKRENFFNFNVFGENAQSTAPTTEVPKVVEESTEKQGFFDRLFAPLKKLFEDKQTAYDEIETALNTEYPEDLEIDKSKAGLSTENSDIITDGTYVEDEVTIKVYNTDGSGKDSIQESDRIIGLGGLKLSDISNKKEIDELREEGRLTTEDTSEVTTQVEYIKYKWYYWRHWGKQRYDYQPKICIQQTINGVKTYKPYNNVTDKVSKSYGVELISPQAVILTVSGGEDRRFVTVEQNGIKRIAKFFLKDRKTSYRQKKETDYEATKYAMKEQSKMSKNHWIEAPNGENYLRKYKFGDGEIELFDGHFGKWVQCYSAEKVATVNTAMPGDGVEGYLPDYYMPYQDIMIPYDERIYDAMVSMTRVVAPYDQNRLDELYVLHNGIYVPYMDYFNTSGFSANLNYDGLKVSFIDHYDYKADHFAISNIPTDKTKYLQFDLSKEPIGYIDLVVQEDVFNNDGRDTIKERWYYWKAKVNKGFALNEDKFASLGMLFEVDQQYESKSYPFLGMQMFKYIPYTKLEGDEELNVSGTDDEGNNINSETEMINAYQELYRSEDNTVPVISIDDLNKKMESHKYLKDMLASKMIQNNKVLFNQYNVEVNQQSETKEVIVKSGVFDVKKVTSEPVTIPLFPGEAPNAKDLYFTNYYIYDPELSNNEDDTIYEYVGRDFTELYAPSYDEQCQSIRSIKGKESNYFKLLQDCCDTFDCWIEPQISHNEETGQVIYVEKKVYVENLNEDSEKEPQIFVGDKAKEKGIDVTTKKLFNRLREKIQCVQNPSTNVHQVGQTYQVKDDQELDEKEQKDLMRLNRLSSMTFSIQYIVVPDKKIRFKRYVGKENWNGFKYGVNLKHIKRTVDSNQISTRVIVKANKNEHGTDGFCTIQRAKENPIKENFLLDFSYYIQQKMLDNSELIGDLYTGVNTKLNYYGKLARLNKENDSLIQQLSSLQIALDNVTAKYETAVLLRDAALEEITKLSQTITGSYDTNGQIMTIPWKYNRAQEYEQRKQTSAPSGTAVIKDTYGEEEFEFSINIPATATVVDYPKYNDTLRNQLDQMDTFQLQYENAITLINKLKPEKERIEADIAEILALSEEIVNKKNELNKLFYYKYSRFIQEGSWVDENYIDDNLYYLDALSVMRTSCKPKITYDIGVVDIAAADEYEEDRLVLESELGDRTYVEDTEFFGYQDDGETPYWEMVVVSEKIYNLEDASQNQTKIKNYSTQFDDLFQRIAATSQTLQFNEGSYSRAAAIVNENGTLNSELLQNTIANSDFILSNSINEDVTWDNTGITVVSTAERANVVKIVSRGILLSSDGGNSYKTAITGEGLNADLLTAGRIDTKMLLIGSSSTPNFFWNELGISAFSSNDSMIDYSSFVRLDQYGIYGIKNYNNEQNKHQLSFNDTFAPKTISEITNNPNAVFGLTWDGFFLNASNGEGRVTIGTEQDFKMSEYSVEENTWKDRVIIGRLQDSQGNEYYGFRLKNNEDQIVMETSDSGELYLKRKLRISNFNDPETYSPFEYVEEKDENGNINEYYYRYSTGTIIDYYKPENEEDIEDNKNYDYIGNIKVYYDINWNEIRREPTNIDWRDSISNPQDRVAVGIVDVYNRNSNFNKIAVPKGTYSSFDYLTKVFSVKANGNVGLEQFSDVDISQLIEKNENFAIFDNGNLFAKNAWIEGHINATSGFFSNMSVYGELIVGDGSGNTEYGTIRSANNLWSISGDGTARFSNAIVSGTISCAIFEKEKIQVVNGSLVVAPQMTLKEITSEGMFGNKYIYKIVCEETSENGELSPDFTEHSLCRLSNTVSAGVIFELYLTKPVYQQEIEYQDTEIFYPSGTNSEIIELENPDKEMQNIVFYAVVDDVITNDDLRKFIEEKTFIFCLGKKEENKIHNTTMISLNGGGNNSVLPEEGLTVFENHYNDQDKTFTSIIKAKLGKMNIPEVPNALQNTYGLYSDNAYLKGTLITQNDALEAGVSTSNYKNWDERNLIFWAGRKDEEPVFSVDEEGVLRAYKGIFKGTVEATEIHSSTIYTSKVVGFDKESGTIGLCFDGLGEAIRFENRGQEFFKLTSSELLQSLDLKVVNKNSTAPLIFGVLQKENIVGLFGSTNASTEDDFGLSFKQNKQNEIEILFKGNRQMTLTNSGIVFDNNQSGATLGTKVVVQDAIASDNTIIGCDIYVED